MKRVVIVSRNRGPDCDAGAVRCLAFSKIYELMGYNVSIFGHGDNSYGQISEKIEYRNFNIKRKYIYDKFLLSGRYKKVVKNVVLREDGIQVIHLVDIPAKAIKYIKRYAKKKKIILVHDSVEWYSACEFKLGHFAPGYMLKNHLNKHLVDCSFRVIAISRFLENYFKDRVKMTIRIPVIMDIANMPMNCATENQYINIAYAGSPVRKDQLENILLALLELGEVDRKRMRMHIIGVERQQIDKVCSLSAKELAIIDECVTFYGRIPRSEVIEKLQMMNYTILARPSEERYAKAGFPTKIVESLSMGIPPICNISSDLDIYLRDKKNAIIAESNTPKDLAEAIVAAISIPYCKWSVMRENARETAEECFDYHLYVNEIEGLINKM